MNENSLEFQTRSIFNGCMEDSRAILELDAEKLHAGLITSFHGEELTRRFSTHHLGLVVWRRGPPFSRHSGRSRRQIHDSWCMTMSLAASSKYRISIWRYFPWLGYTTKLMRFRPRVYY